MKNIIYLFKKLMLLYRYRHNIDRARAIDKYLRYIKFADVKGDYFEFGVYAGETFSYVYHSAQLREQSNLSFLAFDSFEGFSKVDTADDTGVLVQGGRSFSLEQFLKKLKKEKMDMLKVSVIPGWLEDTLAGSSKEKTEKIVGDRKVAIAYLDVDLYEPTKNALDYITERISDGAVLCFDNWFLLKGHPERGERKAFAEWAKENPSITVTPYDQYGWHGQSFIVNKPLE
jgi:O-methyltransferase